MNVEILAVEIAAQSPVVVGDLVAAPGRGDVALDDDQVGQLLAVLFQMEGLDVLVAQLDVDVGRQMPGQGGQSQRWEQ